jgi:hypothetical protein
MTMRPLPTTTAALLAATLIAFSTAAVAVTERVKRECKPDYNRYCSTYAVGSEGLRACMSRSAKKLSKVCVSALVDAGEMTKAQADRLRKSSSSKTTKKSSSKKTTHKRTSSHKRSTASKRSSAPKGGWNPFIH